jgi:membrane protein YqaA with SNARE-associated domain
VESLATWFQQTLLPYGDWGILVLSALDGSFVPMPQVIDMAVMLACALEPLKAWRYAIAAVVGSTAGVMAVYGIARGGRVASKASGKRMAWAEDFLRRRGTLALFIAALMPPPFPFKVVILTAGFLKVPVRSMIFGIGLGRTVRFGAEATLAALYGQTIIAIVQERAGLASLVLAAVVLGMAIAYYAWQKKAFAEAPPATTPSREATPPEKPPSGGSATNP